MSASRIFAIAKGLVESAIKISIDILLKHTIERLVSSKNYAMIADSANISNVYWASKACLKSFKTNNKLLKQSVEKAMTKSILCVRRKESVKEFKKSRLQQRLLLQLLLKIMTELLALLIDSS